MNKQDKKRLVLVELNEVNLDLARSYAKKNRLANLGRILDGDIRRTSSEKSYSELEPWVQWVSAHTGRTAAEHGVFRLGDIVGSKVPQFFEQVEAAGYTVGSISAMNAENRLTKPAYFIPDPWTRTPTDGSFWSENLGRAIAQAVNDNASGKMSGKSIAALLAGLLRFSRLRNYGHYLGLALKSRGAGWRKALFLDMFLHDLHLGLMRKKRPHFSTIFLNAGAHIQHHYLFNARKAVHSDLRNPEWYIRREVDPFEEMLKVYDSIIGDYLSEKDVDLIVATGLTQKPYDRVKHYWRLRDHGEFLDAIGLKYKAVLPRMTRDFLLEFDSPNDAAAGERLLESLVSTSDGVKIFDEIDNRGTSLFVTLTYPGYIEGQLLVATPRGTVDLKPYLAFVAIKNGMHSPDGFVYYKGEVKNHASGDGQHVKEIYNVVLRYFGIDQQCPIGSVVSTASLHASGVEGLSELAASL